MVAIAIALAGLSFYINRDWFAKDTVQIYDRSRPARGFFGRKRQDTSKINPLIFGFSQKLKLTALKVVQISELETNKYPRAFWHIVSESNSIPTKDFTYGSGIQGMHAAIKGAQPGDLEPGVKYRLFVEALSFKGEHDFVPQARTP